MNAYPDGGIFASSAQRVASSYARMLSEFCPDPGFDTTAQADLHALFAQLYEMLYTHPAQFGLPETKDIFLANDHANASPSKAEVKRLLDRPRKQISAGLDFLMHMGLYGRLEDAALLLEADSPQPELLRKKAGRAWLAGLEQAGVQLASSESGYVLASTRFAQMMPALQALAQACHNSEDAELGRVFFTRCDFKALRQDFTLDALDLFRVFQPEESARAAALHSYFIERGYQAEITISSKLAWIIKYQGKKAVKATPLFQMWFDDRLGEQFRAGIKCASAQRIVPLLPGQSAALQEDFAHRAFNCGNCGWCNNQKTLKPLEYTYQGQTRKICWYVPYDIQVDSEEKIHLIQEYTLLHEALV